MWLHLPPNPFTTSLCYALNLLYTNPLDSMVISLFFFFRLIQWYAGASLCQLARANCVHLFLPPAQWNHIGRLKSAIMGVITPQVLANSKIKVLLLFCKPFLKHFIYQSTLGLANEKYGQIRMQEKNIKILSSFPSLLQSSVLESIPYFFLHNSYQAGPPSRIPSHKGYGNIISSPPFQPRVFSVACLWLSLHPL